MNKRQVLFWQELRALFMKLATKEEVAMYKDLMAENNVRDVTKFMLEVVHGYLDSV